MEIALAVRAAALATQQKILSARNPATTPSVTPAPTTCLPPTRVSKRQLDRKLASETAAQRSKRQRLLLVSNLAKTTKIKPSDMMLKYVHQIDAQWLGGSILEDPALADEAMTILNSVTMANIPKTRGTHDTARIGQSGYETFCKLKKKNPWPTSIQLIGVWFSWMTLSRKDGHDLVGYKSATRYIGSLGKYCRANPTLCGDFPYTVANTPEHEQFIDLKKGIVRQVGIPPAKSKVALTFTFLCVFVLALPEPTHDQRCALAILALYVGRGRRECAILTPTQNSNLVRKGRHWNPCTSGDSAILTCPPPKVDKSLLEEDVVFSKLPANNRSSGCPIVLMQDYLDKSVVDLGPDLPLFRRSNGKVCTTDWFIYWVDEMLDRCGIERRGVLCASSFRAGLATDSVRLHQPEDITMMLGSWSTAKGFKPYVQLDDHDLANAQRDIAQRGAEEALLFASQKNMKLSEAARLGMEHAALPVMRQPTDTVIQLHEYVSKRRIS